MWLSLISFILAKLPGGDSHIRRVWVLNFFFQRGTAILHVFWVYAKHLRLPSKSTHSVRPWQISFNAQQTHRHLHIDTHHRYILSSTRLFFSSSFFSVAITRWQCRKERVHWSAKVNKHFMGQISATFRSLNGNCLFHPAASSTPDCWKSLLGRREWGTRVGGPRSGLGRWQIRAPHAAPACTYCRCCLSAHCSVVYTLTCAHPRLFRRTCEALIITLVFFWVSFLSSGKDKSKTWFLYWVWNHWLWNSWNKALTPKKPVFQPQPTWSNISSNAGPEH